MGNKVIIKYGGTSGLPVTATKIKKCVIKLFIIILLYQDLLLSYIRPKKYVIKLLVLSFCNTICC